MTRQKPAQVGLGLAALLCACAVAAAAVPKRFDGAVARKSAAILGTAWKADNTPLPHARLRLRNVVNGNVEGMALANGSGQFTFANVETGSYIVELVNEHGKVLAISQVFAVAPGETVATFVRLGSRGPWLGGLFSNTAATAVAAASSLGLTALGSNGQPVSAAPGTGR